MPLGLDTPSTFGSVILIIGPAFQAALGRGLAPEAAAQHAWFLGITMLLASGIFKLACALVSGWVREVVPRAGLLGSLTAIALVIISFLPLLDIAAQPVAGFVSLAVILATLTARWRLPRQIPGRPGGRGRRLPGLLRDAPRSGWARASAARGPRRRACSGWPCRRPSGPGGPGSASPGPRRSAICRWRSRWPWRRSSAGIDCTESAAAAGDDYPTGQIIAAEGIATLVGGLFGGVIQSTPYIGHPAYKAMGARAGYTLATALFVGAAGIFGYFDWIFFLIPKAVIFPILIFIGLEITAQSFHATSARHYPAVALACVPALAYLALITLNQVLPGDGQAVRRAAGRTTQQWIATVDDPLRRLHRDEPALGDVPDPPDRRPDPATAAATLALAGVFAWFGIIHSPLPPAPIKAPSAVLRQLRAEGRARAAGAPDALSLGRRLRRHGGHGACSSAASATCRPSTRLEAPKPI